MKLGGEKGLALVPHPFVGIIVQVVEQGIPAFGQGIVVDGKAMVL